MLKVFDSRGPPDESGVKNADLSTLRCSVIVWRGLDRVWLELDTDVFLEHLPDPDMSIARSSVDTITTKRGHTYIQLPTPSDVLPPVSAPRYEPCKQLIAVADPKELLYPFFGGTVIVVAHPPNIQSSHRTASLDAANCV